MVHNRFHKLRHWAFHFKIRILAIELTLKARDETLPFPGKEKWRLKYLYQRIESIVFIVFEAFNF